VIVRCFTAMLLIGLGFLLIGVCVVPVLPYFQLDAVLDDDELADAAKKAATLEILKRASGNQWVFWTVGGGAVAAISALGLWKNRRSTPAPAEERSQ
jgi:hypothetical protein